MSAELPAHFMLYVETVKNAQRARKEAQEAVREAFLLRETAEAREQRTIEEIGALFPGAGHAAAVCVPWRTLTWEVRTQSWRAWAGFEISSIIRELVLLSRILGERVALRDWTGADCEAFPADTFEIAHVRWSTALQAKGSRR
jgi:hypothetical protein